MLSQQQKLPVRGTLRSQPGLMSGSSRRAELIVVLFLLVLGGCTILFRQRTPDFMGEDVFWADAARSLLTTGFYGVGGVVETTQPPGLALALAGAMALFGYSYSVCFVLVGVCQALGLAACFLLLRRHMPWLGAALICTLVATSPVCFELTTRFVSPSPLFFFATMVALIAAEEYDEAETWRSLTIWGSLLAAALVASILIATSTVVLAGAVIAFIFFSFFRSWSLARKRLLKFLPVVLLAAAIQGTWMQRKPAPLQWTLPGYPASYLQQIKLKVGNDPELGLATWRDIPTRLRRNALGESSILAEVFLRHEVNPAKPGVALIPILLIGTGLLYTLFQSGGMDVVAWYFVGYQLAYLLWPWDMETRFILPIAPLAALYVWVAIGGSLAAMRARPRNFGAALLPLALLVGVLAGRHLFANRAWRSDFSEDLLFPAWLLVAACSLWMSLAERSVLDTPVWRRLEQWLEKPLGRLRLTALALVRYAALAAAAAVILVGLGLQKRMAAENLRTTGPGSAPETGMREILDSEVRAGLWLRSHTPADSVVMARHWPTVRHYSLRRPVWFAPIAEPETLLRGIVKNQVDYVVVIRHPRPYYLPDDGQCFDPLLVRYPGVFRLVMQSGNVRIFRVDRRLVLSVASLVH